MTSWQLSKVALAVLGAGVAAWCWRTPAPPAAVVQPSAPPPETLPAASPAAADTAPLIAVAADGNVTLRVEQRPLEWVLEQIALQTGSPVEPGRHAAAAGPVPAPPQQAPDACTAAAAPAPEAEQLLGTIQRGDEPSRHDALLRARGAGVAVPDGVLKTLFETDASDRVRLLAFESWLETRQDSADAMRQALQSALEVPSAAIQHEARRLLAQLQDVERADADGVQSTGP